MSEKLATVGDVRKVLQDLPAPELAELTVTFEALSDHHGSVKRARCESFNVRIGGRQEMEARPLRKIKNFEEKLLIRTRLAEYLLREIKTLKREKAQ